MNTEKKYVSEPEVDLKEIVLILWSRKILIIAITTLSIIISLLYALSLPNIYTSKSLLTSVAIDSSLNSKASDYSALASFAGININSGNASKSDEAIERIKSFDFFSNHFLNQIKLENLMAAKDWDHVSNKIIYDQKLFDESNSKWVRKVSYPFQPRPTYQEAFIEYMKILTINIDKKSSFVSIEIKHVSPHIAKKWSYIIINSINNLMREIDRSEAKNSIDFLNNTAQATQLSGLTDVISKLLEDQIRTLVLAESSSDYVFKIISSPIAPEQKSEPSRLLILIYGSIAGLIIAASLSILQYYINRE